MSTNLLGALETEVCGETLALLPERAVFWPAANALWVADVHLGKAATFQHFGLGVPDGELSGNTRDDLQRLSAALTATHAAHLFILGDLLHAAHGRAEHVLALVQGWRERHRHVEMTLLRGNHDQRAGDPPEAWGMRCQDEPLMVGPFALCHEPNTCQGQGYEIAGHLHPGLTLSGPARQRERLPCFVFGPHGAVLPAFGSFTGLASLPRRTGQRLFVVADRAVIALGG